MRNEKGFTLVEMLIVLLVISVLMILVVPNLADKNDRVQTQGCDALVKLAESQVQTYKIDHGTAPSSLSQLQDGYLTETTCQGGKRTLVISPGGGVSLTDVSG
ncbi:competence protein ComGC [Terribacillus halophilus]|uniref:ComG operon protein 3 n=1 Tax=Terribacillus halophilus TaxID=361279 RepID=A0A1G6VK82_9BACI|nr:competence type IV pilus major pilin ComGC [Terribacillus halophilus]SDD53803.1 competence protein ComGC [Terribacillus halophilus]